MEWFGRLKTVFMYFTAKGRQGNPQKIGSARPVPLRMVKGFQYVSLFRRLQRKIDRIRERPAASCSQLPFDIFKKYPFTPGSQRRSHDYILQLSNIPDPGLSAEYIHNAVFELLSFRAVLSGGLLQKMPRQVRNITYAAS